MRHSAASIDDGNEHNLMDSDELLQKGILKLARCSPPLDALLLQDDSQSEALLPDHLLELEVVSDSSMVMNSGEVFGEQGENREEERNREIEIGRRRSRVPRWCSRRFYRAGVVGNVSFPAAMVGIRQ
jgi:hypothetical protein